MCGISSFGDDGSRHGGTMVVSISISSATTTTTATAITMMNTITSSTNNDMIGMIRVIRMTTP